MRNNRWNFYTSKEIKPSGWLRTQLEIQARGLSGNLDKVWPDIRDSKWIGGDAEGWERVPYWLDGFVPLAYLLEDEDLIARAGRYIDAILAFQKPDGWICPCTDEERESYDTWVVLLICKTLKVYYDCSGDERIPEVIYRVMKNFYELLSSGTLKLFKWGESRWYEGFIALNFLQERYHESWIAELADILYQQRRDYRESMQRWERPINKREQDTHIVNIAMMLKSEAVSCDLLGQKYTDQAEKFYRVLKKYNGTPVETFTGDEHLSGLSPIQGTELCSVVEQMYSYEELYAYTGDAKWAERLEVLAFNALPATFSDDMWAHQYVQQSNQITCKAFPRDSKVVFRTNGREAHLFGLEPNYGCCTANLSQGWPKLTTSAYMFRGNKIISVLPIPTVLNTCVDTAAGKMNVRVELETNYPFENQFTYRITSEGDGEFGFMVRVPSFAENVMVNGQSFTGKEASFRISGSGETTISLSWQVTPELVKRPHSLKTVKCGSLVFALPIAYEKVMLEYERKGVERKYPYCDYEYIGVSDWEYGFADDEFELVKGEDSTVAGAPEADGYIFSSEKPPVMLKAHMKKIHWGLEDGFEYVCAKRPVSYKGIGEKEEILLYPYGCAKLRMTEMPLVK